MTDDTNARIDALVKANGWQTFLTLPNFLASVAKVHDIDLEDIQSPEGWFSNLTSQQRSSLETLEAFQYSMAASYSDVLIPELQKVLAPFPCPSPTTRAPTIAPRISASHGGTDGTFVASLTLFLVMVDYSVLAAQRH